MDHKRFITTLLSSVLLISSSGGYIGATSDSDNMMSSSAKEFISKNNLFVDKVNTSAPKVSIELGTEIPQMNKKIEISFSQTLDTANADLYAYDLTIKQLGVINVPTLVPMVDYTTAVEGNKIVVTFLGDYTDEYAVQVKDAVYIRANGIAATQSVTYFTTKNVDTIM